LKGIALDNFPYCLHSFRSFQPKSRAILAPPQKAPADL
jgi:hypothetical protein